MPAVPAFFLHVIDFAATVDHSIFTILAQHIILPHMRITRIHLLFIAFLFAAESFAQPPHPGAYFPPAGSWEHRLPASMNIDTGRLNEAIRFVIAAEAKLPRDQELAQAMSFGKEPFSDGIGPFVTRGDPAGIIIYKGYIIAEWGDPSKVDMTHSVTKSFLSAVVGVAVDKGLIRDVTDTVASYIPDIVPADLSPYRSADALGQPQLIRLFATPHNRRITWDVMLRQTSDWEGVLWGKPDWADRPGDKTDEWLTRKRNEPGAVWKYNDVRVNALALAALAVWRKPLPQVLRENIMAPIGASNSWHWEGYRNSLVVLDGQIMQSVSGGGHWGGGMFINAFDMGRFGLLTLHRGNWNGKQLLSENWVKRSLTLTTANTGYGYMNWFLNTNKKMLPDAPETAFVHLGNGVNMIYVDPEHDLVAVIRWIEQKEMNGAVKRILAALHP